MWSRTYFFPEGRADVRYQLDKFGDPDESFFSKAVKTRRGATMEWSIKLSRTQGNIDNLGTLEAMLVKYTLWPAQAPSPAVLSSLKARKGFAVYRSGTMWDQVAYYYLYPDGDYPNEGLEPGFDKPKGWPLSKKPYPIPAAEVERLRQIPNPKPS